MSERKVLNKYYPPDFDPTKLPKLKREKNRQFVIRIMAPFSMRCKTCGEYIYKGRKFNSRMETVENETYLGLRIYRFYVRCPKCISEITFKTDPENTDYLMEHGATRNFQAYRKLEEQIEREKKSKEEEEANNPMKALENRTKDSKREMESIEKLEELKDLNQRLASIDHDKLIADHLKVEDDWLAQQEAEDEELVRKIFGRSASDPDGYVRRILDDHSSGSSDEERAGKSSAFVGGKGNKRAATDAVAEESSVALPAVRPGFSKSKLINPVKDISVMIKPRTVARLEQSETSSIHEGSAEPVTQDSKDVHVQSLPSSSSVNPSSADNEQDYVEDRPVFKIALKKPKIDDSSNIKGNSLSLLGGYDSGNSDDGLG